MSTLPILLRRFQAADGRARGILVDARSYAPSIAASVYEASLSRRCRSPNTLYHALSSAQLLLSWACEAGFDIERRILNGLSLELQEIEAFAHWLDGYCRGSAAALTRSGINTYNAHLAGAQRMVAWFVDRYCDSSQTTLPRGVFLDALQESSKRAWKSQRIKGSFDPIAPDLSDDDISAIETFLHNAATCERPERRWVRAYLIWRLAIEFGLRIGEILALRVEDCPSRTDPAFRIVRIDGRDGEQDPRGVYAPRPKSLGRELAPILSNSVFPRLVIDYMADHRVKKMRRAGGHVIWRPVMSHPYLLVDDGGDPLSVFTTRNLAKSIEENTGVRFTWHLARHAFFNRAYAAAASVQDPTQRSIRLNDLIYWGGWCNPSSLDCYVRRARMKRARTGLAIWNGLNRWEALG